MKNIVNKLIREKFNSDSTYKQPKKSLPFPVEF